MLIFPDPKVPPRTTRPIFGGPIHAAALNRQQRPDHKAAIGAPFAFVHAHRFDPLFDHLFQTAK